MTFRGQHLSAKRGPALSKRSASNGFTLVELLIGATLSAAVMAAVLSSYVYLAKHLVRLTNQQTLENEGRRTLGYFTRDVQMATGISGTPSATGVTLSVPTTAGTTTVAYVYDSSAGTLTRTPAGGTALILLRNITSSGLNFYYYDSSGNIYTAFTNYLPGIKQMMLQFSTQTGQNSNGTQTLVHQVSSSRLIVRNKAVLP